jgi:hypothetical protein
MQRIFSAAAASVLWMAQMGYAATPATTTASVSPARKSASSQDFPADLAKASLAKQGVKNPTPAQLADAQKSIQAQRASGMGWGEIAHSLGLTFGKVVSASHRANPSKDPAKHAAHAKSHESHDKKGHYSAHGRDHDKNHHDHDGRGESHGGHGEGHEGGHGGGGNGGGHGK